MLLWIELYMFGLTCQSFCEYYSIDYILVLQRVDSTVFYLEREVKDKRLNMNEMNAKDCKHEQCRSQGGTKRSGNGGTVSDSRADGEHVLYCKYRLQCSRVHV